MPRHQRGFTLIELIVVIILIGIISVTAASRIIGRSSFDAYVARDQAISIARSIQVTGMNHIVNTPSDDPRRCYALLVTSNLFGSPSCSSETTSSRQLTTDSDKVSFSINEPVSTIYFDALGRPFSFDSSNQKVAICQADGCEVTFSSRSNDTAVLCLNREGYIGVGGCS